MKPKTLAFVSIFAVLGLTWLLYYPLANFQRSSEFRKTLAVAREQGSDSLVVENLRKHNINEARPDMSAVTPLMQAASKGELLVVRRLLQAGADPGKKDSSGRIASELAAVQGHHEIRDELVHWEKGLR